MRRETNQQSLKYLQETECSRKILDQNVEQEKMMCFGIFMHHVYNKIPAATLIQILFAIVPDGWGPDLIIPVLLILPFVFSLLRAFTYSK